MLWFSRKDLGRLTYSGTWHTERGFNVAKESGTNEPRLKRKGSVERRSLLLLGPQQLWLLIWHLASSPTPGAPSVYLPPASCPGHHTQAYAPTLPSSPYSRSSRTSLLDKVWFPPANIALAEFLVFGQQAWLNKKSKAQVTTRIHTVGTSCFVSLRILKLQNIPSVYILSSVLGFPIRWTLSLMPGLVAYWLWKLHLSLFLCYRYLSQSEASIIWLSCKW